VEAAKKATESPCGCSGRREHTDDNRVPGYLKCIAEDVTEKRVLERQLRMGKRLEAIGRIPGGSRTTSTIFWASHRIRRVLKESLGREQMLCASMPWKSRRQESGPPLLTRELLAFKQQV